MARTRDIDGVMFQLEAHLTKHVKEYLDSLKPQGHFWKASDRYKPGVADFIGCYKGKFVAIELKAEDGLPSTPQIQFLANIATAGGYMLIAKTVWEVKNLIYKLDAELSDEENKFKNI